MLCRGLAIIAMMLGLCSPTLADVVVAKGRGPLVDTQVSRLADGKLFCRGETGGEVGLPVEQIEYMQVLGWQMFNLAEKQRRSGEWHRAAVSYEKVLADLQLDEAAGKAGTDKLDRMLLVKCRLVQACDALGRFERALELYLDVVERMPMVADSLRPKRIPETGHAWLEQADKRIDAAIAKHRDDELGRRLNEWRKSWPRLVASAPAMPADVLPGSLLDPRMIAAIGEIAGLVEAGRPVDALSRIISLRNEARGDARAELFYWQGRSLLAMAGTGGQNANDAAATKARAGLAFMRVVVHFPRHQLAGECLYRAGQLCKLAGRPEQAKALWMELATNYPKAKGPDGTAWADKVREEIK